MAQQRRTTRPLRASYARQALILVREEAGIGCAKHKQKAARNHVGAILEATSATAKTAPPCSELPSSPRRAFSFAATVALQRIMNTGSHSLVSSIYTTPAVRRVYICIYSGVYPVRAHCAVIIEESQSQIERRLRATVQRDSDH